MCVPCCWLANAYTCTCSCVLECVWEYRKDSVLVYGSLCLVGCVILRQQPEKMLHLLSGDLHTSTCVQGWLDSCVLVCGSLCLVGCVILRQLPEKMLHLLSGDPHTGTCAFRREALGSACVCACSGCQLVSCVLECLPIDTCYLSCLSCVWAYRRYPSASLSMCVCLAVG